MNNESGDNEVPLQDDPDPSDSAVQRLIEVSMLNHLNEQHLDWRRVPWEATAAALGLPPVWQKAEPDAIWKSGSGEIVIAEAYARIGKMKPGHRRKLAMDALKLIALQDALPDGTRVRCLLVVPQELVCSLESAGWFSTALRLAAEIVPAELSDYERTRLSDACRRQAQGQSRTRRAKKDCAE